MFQIESFKNAISARYGLARNNLWRIQLPTRPAYLGGDTFSERDGRILNLMCNATQLPGRQITTNDRQYGIKSEKMAQGFLKDDVSLSFYENNVYTIRRYFQDWQNRVLNQNSYEIRYKNEYAETVTMQQLDHEEKNNRKMSYIFVLFSTSVPPTSKTFCKTLRKVSQIIFHVIPGV